MHSLACFSMKTTSWTGQFTPNWSVWSCLHSCDILLFWLRSKFTGMTY